MASKEELQAIQDRVTRQSVTDGIKPPGIFQKEHDAVFIECAKAHPDQTAGQIEETLTWAGYWAVPEPTVKPATSSVQRSPTVSNIVIQGDTRGLTQHRGPHTLTAAEIIAEGNRPDPTAPYFDPNSDQMRLVDPLEPHYDFSTDFHTLVEPLKPRLPSRNFG